MSRKNIIFLVVLVAGIFTVITSLYVWHRVCDINYPIDINLFASYGALLAGTGAMISSILLYINFKVQGKQFEKQQFLSSFSQLMQIFFNTLDNLTSYYIPNINGRKLFITYSAHIREIRGGQFDIEYHRNFKKNYTNINTYINDNSSELGLFINLFENMLDVINRSSIAPTDKQFYAKIFYTHLAPGEKEIINEVCKEDKYKTLVSLRESLQLK